MIKIYKRDKKYRLVEAETKHIAKSKNNRSVDGGGHRSRSKAERQAGYINKAPRRPY